MIPVCELNTDEDDSTLRASTVRGTQQSNSKGHTVKGLTHSPRNKCENVNKYRRDTKKDRRDRGS
jgi:hypothetical protein